MSVALFGVTLLGLLITEGTSPAPEGLGCTCIPGIFSDTQVARLQLGAERSASELAAFYTPGPVDYTDYAHLS